MHVRAVEPKDFEAIASLTSYYIEHTAIHFGYEPLTAAQAQAEWEQNRGTFPYLVAEVDGVFAGYAKAYTWRSRAAYRHTAETGIYVARDGQGKGVGKELYRALIAACREAGFRVLVAGIALPNEASCRLHERVGFTQVGVFKDVGFKFNAWHDVGFYQLVLETA